MEGLKLIAQATFDRHQKFRPNSSTGEGGGSYRYNVIEVGAFGPPRAEQQTQQQQQQQQQTPQQQPLGNSVNTGPGTGTATATGIGVVGTAAALKRQSIGHGGSIAQQQNLASGAGAGAGAGSSSSRQNGSAGSRVTLNEWMVYHEDLGAFMKKRPVELVSPTSGSGAGKGQQQQQQQQQSSSSLAQQPNGTGPSGTVTTSSTGYSRSFSQPSSRMTGTSSTTATTGTSMATAGNDKGHANARRSSTKEEVEAVASLKLICIQRTDLDLDLDLDNDNDNANDNVNIGADPNTLAISREAFLRLYVDLMHADHCALYYLAREYDGLHEFTDQAKAIVTKFLGLSDFALVWTFNRRTLETRGLFLDRCQRWQSKDGAGGASASATAPAPAPAHPPPPRPPSSSDAYARPGSAPVTPVRKLAQQQGDNSSSVQSTPSKKWTGNRTGTVTASEAWLGFREILNMYRGFVYAPQLLNFVSCVYMLRSFDDHVNGDDLPLLKEVEKNMSSLKTEMDRAAEEEKNGRLMGEGGEGGRVGGGGGGGGGGGNNMPTQQSSFAIVPEHNPFAPSTPPNETADKMDPAAALAVPLPLPLPLPPPPLLLDRQRLVAQSVTANQVDTSLSNKLRHLTMVRTMFEALAREHETVIADVVAPEFLDRYHWAMEGMTEAIPALERHMASLEEYLRYLKGRSERLSGLVRCLTLVSIISTNIQATTTSSSSAPCRLSRTQSDALSLRCNEADSRSDLGGLGRALAVRPAIGGGGNDVSPTPSAVEADDGSREGGPSDGGPETAARRVERGQRNGRNLSFYAGYLFRGNYSHRLT